MAGPEAGGVPVLLQSRRSSNEGSEKIKAGGAQSKRHDGGVAIGAIFPGTRRPLEELLTAMRKGADLMKHGRQGKPKIHYFRLADNDTLLTWRSAKGNQRSVPLNTVTQVVAGQTTDSFKRYPNPEFVRLSFSLLYKDSKADGALRTLDLTANNDNVFELWFWGLKTLVEFIGLPLEKATGKDGIALASLQLSSPLTGAVGMPFGGPESGNLTHKGPVLAGTKAVHPDGTAKAFPTGVGGGTAQGRATGAVGVPVPEHQPGDCYMWGASRPSQPAFGSPRAWVQSSLPQSIRDTTHLDVMEVAVGLGHAGLLTRGGEMYTWGDGLGGKLGLGHQQDADIPQHLHTLWGQPVRHIAVSDSCTAAITGDGQLLTWGEATMSSLGYSGVQRQYIPRPVVGPLSDHVVVQVSCGPFHSAAVTSDGCLFTWGNGLCGKLGHGDHSSCLVPRQVDALKDKRVTQAACGAWHTAAVASPRPHGPNVLGNLPFIERLAVQHKLAAMYELTEEDDGVLYTWGCTFTWTTQTKDDAGKSTRTPDHHRGCLGHGDTAGRMTPTRVGGKLEDLAVTNLAVGLAFTVAATSDGRVWQMGETGVSGKGAPWEGALVPCQVGGALAKHFVENVSAGRHHVAAMAGPLNSATGKAHEGLESTVVFMWGRGQEGQLGGGSCTDSATPHLVEQLRGCRILQVACGGYQTMAVCLHDPKTDDTEERRKGYKAKMKNWFSGGRLSLDLPSKDATASGPPSASSAASAKSHIPRDSGLPQSRKPGGTQIADPKTTVALKKTLSGSGLMGVPVDKIAGRRGRRKAFTTSEFGVPPSGMSTPTRAGHLHSSTEMGFASDSNLTPRGGEDSTFRASSENDSKHSSYNGVDRLAMELAAQATSADAREAVEKEAYVKSLEAKVEQLQSLLKQQSMSTTSRMGLTARFVTDARPSIVDLSSPLSSFTDGPRMSLASFASTSKPEVFPGASPPRSSLAGLAQTQKRQSRVAQLPNARTSMLLHSLEDVNSADVPNLTKEAAELARMHAALAYQLAQVEHRQAALHAAGIDPPEQAAADPRPGGIPSRASERMHGAGPASTSKAARQGQEATIKRRDTGARLRTGHHRRSRSGSGSSSLKSPAVSPFAVAQSSPLPSPGAMQTLAPKEPIGSEEVAPGVFLSLEPDGEGHNRLTRIRFARQRFSREAADAWWHTNKHELARRYSLRGSDSDRAPLSDLNRTASAGTATVRPSSSGSSSLQVGGMTAPMGAERSPGRLVPDSHYSTGSLRRVHQGEQALPVPKLLGGGTLEEGWNSIGERTLLSGFSTEGFQTSRSRFDTESPTSTSRPPSSCSIREHAVSPSTSTHASTSPEDSPEHKPAVPALPIAKTRHTRTSEDADAGQPPGQAALQGSSKRVSITEPHIRVSKLPSTLLEKMESLGILAGHDSLTRSRPSSGGVHSEDTATETQLPRSSRPSKSGTSSVSLGSTRSSNTGEVEGAHPMLKQEEHARISNRLSSNTARLVAAWEGSRSAKF